MDAHVIVVREMERDGGLREKGGSWDLSLAANVYITIYITPVVNRCIYMDFRDAVDLLCSKLDHADVAKSLEISVQGVRQARMDPKTGAFRSPPKDWENAIIRMAEDRIWHYRKLIEQIRESRKGGKE
jgi:hypothetical protein